MEWITKWMKRRVYKKEDNNIKQEIEEEYEKEK